MKYWTTELKDQGVPACNAPDLIRTRRDSHGKLDDEIATIFLAAKKDMSFHITKQALYNMNQEEFRELIAQQAEQLIQSIYSRINYMYNHFPYWQSHSSQVYEDKKYWKESNEFYNKFNS